MDKKCIKAYWRVPEDLFACVYDPSANIFILGKEGKERHKAAQLYCAKLFGDVMMAYEALKENKDEAAFETTLSNYNKVRDALEKRLVQEQCMQRLKNVELCLHAFFL